MPIQKNINDLDLLQTESLGVQHRKGQRDPTQYLIILCLDDSNLTTARARTRLTVLVPSTVYV